MDNKELLAKVYRILRDPDLTPTKARAEAIAAILEAWAGAYDPEA